jgi:hypothetical protein
MFQGLADNEIIIHQQNVGSVRHYPLALRMPKLRATRNCKGGFGSLLYTKQLQKSERIYNFADDKPVATVLTFFTFG